ncbi:MAG TPA: carboxymuconolactone decarboxylase family protein [Candidatus Limnocylindrales bacterium]|nr:carboxymuconolactone decarboxylase family protein [Candidatus Limnocylindrales bacterium]
MARIPYVDPSTAPDEVRAAFDALPAHLNIFRTMAHATNSFRPLLRLGSSILGEQQLDPKLREYAILLAARSLGGRYEWVQHVPIAIACGATQEQVDALERGELDAAVFGDVERRFLAFVQESIDDTRPSDATFEAASSKFSSRELVETLLTVGYYQMLARLTECMDVELDEPIGMKVVKSATANRRS